MAVALACGLTGCGGDDEEYANRERPPAPITVTAAVTPERVTVSPETFGAGPINLIVSNQSTEAQRVTFETDEVGGEAPGLRQVTSPINPSGTATLQVDVREGSYRLSADGRGVRAAALEVGERRASAQDALRLP